MEQSVKETLDKYSIQVINPILNKRAGGKEVGWHCKLNSIEYFRKVIDAIEKKIEKEKVPYNVQTLGDDEREFMIMINQ